MNQLDEEDFALLEKKPVHVVHCPASHQYFRHAPFPMERLREIGINVSLGTDSLASTESLSLFAEMRNVCDNFPSVSPREALEMVTLNPAKALRRQRELGRISVKARADLIALPIAPGDGEVYEEIVAHRKRVDWMMVNGQVLE
jgi:cytosine/adenosine deaminase-related metal-dependent hydrolase